MEVNYVVPFIPFLTLFLLNKIMCSLWMFHVMYLSLMFVFCILQEQETQKQDIWFNFQKTKYVYDSEEKKQFCQVAFPISEAMEHYNSCKGYQEEVEVERAKKKYGLNE